ncbi:MAG TPA: hypothetical protein VFQ77_06005 [Pseudonocardiaceae bacterium]|nr:hypothetical protein [Pseudonocardiaceae bacterium]
MGDLLGIPFSFRLMLTSRRTVRTEQVVKMVPETAWNRASCGRAPQGDRTYAWAWVVIASPAITCWCAAT